jgi:hypothetical protein
MRLVDAYAINDDELLVRSANAVTEALGKLSQPLLQYDAIIFIRPGIYEFTIPCWMKRITGIFNCGKRLTTDEYKFNHGRLILSPDGLPITSDVLGRDETKVFCKKPTPISIHYKHLNLEYDVDTNVWWPRIPDNEYVLDYLTKYCLLYFVQRGASVPLNINYSNAIALVEQARKACINELSNFSLDELLAHTEFRNLFMPNLRDYVTKQPYYSEQEFIH